MTGGGERRITLAAVAGAHGVKGELRLKLFSESAGSLSRHKTLYVAGQEGTDENGKLVSGGIAAETKAALENIQKVVKTAGFDMKDIVSVTVYLADIKEFGDMNTVYKQIMPDPKPARATIQAAALVNNARIEVSAVAVKQK